MSLARYSLIVLGLAALSIAAVWPALGAATGARGAVLFGAALAAANTLAAYALVLWSEGQPTKAFMTAVLGGMIGRLLLMLAGVVAGALWLGLPKLPLVAALLGYFVLFLVFELSVVHKRTTPRASPR